MNCVSGMSMMTATGMVIKKVPGAGEVYLVYDARDRLAYTRMPICVPPITNG